MEMPEMKKMLKMTKKYNCINCVFECSKLSNYNAHLMTAKHQKSLIGNNLETLEQNNCIFCNKKYKSKSGLWKHNKICFQEAFLKKESLPINNLIIEMVELQKQNQTIIIQNQEFKNLIKEPEEKENIITTLIEENQSLKDFMLKQHEEFKDLIVEVCKNNQITNINNNTLINSNSNNKTFNLQFFLNEECKDAMNITEFANSIVIDLEELESIGKLGYVNSITNIIKERLNLLDIHKRPVHCTDLKRETIYIKDNNVWEKDTTNKFLKGIAVISKKNCSMIYIFKDKYPDYKNPQSKQSDVYDVLCSKIYHASDENIHKVIKKLLKEITIDK
jgi:hypothetical protein